MLLTMNSRLSSQLELILDSSLNAIFAAIAIRDAQGKIMDFKITHINKAFTRLVGYSPAEAIGKCYLSLFPSTLYNGMFQINCEVVETGKSQHTETYYKDPRITGWYDVFISKMGEDELLVTFIDITEQKTGFLKLQEQKNLMDNILRHSANGISVTRVIRNEKNEVVDGRTLVANEAAAQIVGIPKGAYVSKTIRQIEPNILQSEFYKLCLKTLETGEPTITRYLTEFSKRWLEVTISKLDDDHLIAIFTDVTQIQEAELKQQQLIEELKRSNEHLEEFTWAASHDLKEPIRKVQILTDILRETTKDHIGEEGKKVLGKIENAAKRMMLLVNDLLAYSRIGGADKHADEVDLNDKLILIITDLEVMIREKNAAIVLHPLPTVKGFRMQLQQLFQNLIINSLKYSKPNVPPVIEIYSTEVTGLTSGLSVAPQYADKAYYKITIKDNGIGFPEENANMIFAMFQRLHTCEEYSGSGIGLSIAKRVVENHGGYIRAESKPGEGAMFHILLPK
jgi:PAS domain S-box-containing protein